MNLLTTLKLFSLVTFMTYGLLCLFSRKMVSEFERYGLAQFRVLVGVLEVTGAIGQLGSFFFAPLGLLASSGLALLMICGLWARWRIRDPWFTSLPALTLFLLNTYLVWKELSSPSLNQ